jgi:hypothetical protein
MDSSKRMTLVTNVITDVTNVIEMLMTVSLVHPIPEDQLLSVHVKMVTTKMEALIVQSVIQNVSLVIPSNIVINVPSPDKSTLNQPAHVPTEPGKINITPVTHVDTNVNIVKTSLVSVNNVKISELQPPIVHVQLDISMMVSMLHVSLVLKNVSPVLITLSPVPFVLLIEFKMLQVVHVNQVTLKSSDIVNLVIGDVMNVITVPETVVHVKKTESKLQLVIVQKVPSKLTDKLFAQLVTLFVKNVLNLPPTV